MDVERSCGPAPPSLQLQAGLETVKKWQRIRGRARRALPAVCVVAATVLAVVVLSAAWDGSPTLPSSWFPVQEDVLPPSNLTDDQLLDGLLTAEFGSRSCRSRYGFASYHDNKKKHKPSPYLLAKLRRHEALQKRCGPGTAPYRAAIQQLKSGHGALAADAGDCRYLISVSYRGLGNRMLATASAFLYAVLTERALLIQHDLGALFCEPFPGTTWLLPASGCLGNMLKTNVLSVGADGNASWSDADGGRRRPPYVYLHLEGQYDFHDKLFYCDEQQRLLRGAPWLLMKTDSYLAPGLFLVPSFQDELGRMFPEKDAARVPPPRAVPVPPGERRVARGDEILRRAPRVRRAARRHTDPGVQTEADAAAAARPGPGTSTRALSEIYLLSTCDVLVTTGFSTFGYVAQGLGGVRPWIMPATPIWSIDTGEVPDPPCVRAMSVEPCFHSPSYYDRAARKDVDVAKVSGSARM
ncbi:unnamed protein product [Alopecurus aequalis]